MTCIRFKHDTARRFGFYGKRHIQRYRCTECHATFADPKPASPITFGASLNCWRRERIIRAAMADTTKSFHCWIVQCKTPKCPTALVLHVFAETEPPNANGAQEIYMLRECKAFRETCPECHQEHSYSRANVERVVLENQPLGYLSTAFARAIAPPEPENAASAGDTR